MRKTILLLSFVGLFLSCEKETTTTSSSTSGSHPCGANETDRVGARYNDGTSSTATGSGACSGHGGVNYWLCK